MSHEPSSYGQPETLQSGPDRAPLLDRLASGGPRRGVVVAFVAGVLCGGAGVWWWTGTSSGDSPEADREPVTRPALVLTRVVASTRAYEVGAVSSRPLRVEATLLYGGPDGAATVTRIHREGGYLGTRARSLPVRLSADHPVERIRLEVTPRDCRLADQWTPSARPFTITWRDASGEVHRDLGGEHDVAVEVALVDHFNGVCGTS